MEGNKILGEVLKITGLTKNSLAKEIGLLRSQNLYDIELGKVKKISSELSEKIVIRFPNFNRQWLLTGKGSMLINSETQKAIRKLPSVEELNILSTGYYYPNVNAAAGFDKEGLISEIEKIPVNIPNWGNGLDFINVFGDSMYPKFNSGEIIGIKEIEKQFLNYGYAYVVQFNNGEVYLKYIKKGKDDKHWLLVSENTFYEPKEFLISSIKSVFIIKGVLSKITM
jgi:phage repressor protein C with HTH and peptisase S24 domain